MGKRVSLWGVAQAVVIVGMASVSAADVIHLTNGSVIQVDAWRDVGDAIEFARGGGIIRILKADIAKIDGQSTRTDLRMYSAPASVTPAAPAPAGGGPVLERAAAVKEMTDLLKQADGLFAQTVIDPKEKAAAFRRLGEKWQALSVPEALRETHGQGQQALQIAAEAFTVTSEGTAPDAKERVEKAKTALTDAQAAVQKAGGAG